MDILVFRTGCMNCVTLEKRVFTAVNELNVETEVFKISDYAKIAEYGVIKNPALVINEKVIFYWNVPKAEELKKYFIKGVN